MAFVLLLMCCIFVQAAAADAEFEKSVSAFPESYKPALRKLHEKHPNWTFTPLYTNLDWYDAVENEYADDISLVTNDSRYTDIFKSREADDYVFSTGKYIEKDSGFVKANKLAIAYYMDPRNFLSEQGIFQFENLSFDEKFNVSAIETVLNGTFMSNKKISYLTADGTTVNTNETYSQVLYQAGKQYNINPCFLAAKIISEVGKSGSGSVSGKYGSYPGIYNFYNIGANDNPSGAIEGGLKWASTGSTYQRPWNTPKKSIMGGAQFLAEKYIAKGQHTSYLQRFNVNPSAYYKTYTHQYMTNLTGAALPAYTNYQSYLASGIIDFSFNFLIPVYNNMTGEDSTDGFVRAADSYNQTGSFTTSSSNYNVRTGPSTSNSTLGFTLPSGTQVKILDTVFTDATYYDSIMRYPFWKKISFSKDSQTYTGYVYSNFIALSTYTIVRTGLYSPVEFKSNPSLSLGYISSDPSVAAVVNDTTVKFLKPGTVEITAYDSVGNYQVIKYKAVDNTDKYDIKNVRVSEDEDGSLIVDFDSNSCYNYYEVFVTDSNNIPLKGATVRTNKAVFTGLLKSESIKVYVRGLKKSGNNKIYSSFTNPVALVLSVPVPTGVKAALSGYHSVKVSWNKVDGASGYEISVYDKNTGKYTKLAAVSASTGYYLDKSENLLSGADYSIRAYVKNVSGETVWSDYSQAVSFAPAKISVSTVSGLTQTAAGKNEVTLSWSKVNDADFYEIYSYNVSTKENKLVATATSTTAKITGLAAGAKVRYRVKAVVTLFGKNYRSGYSSYIDACAMPSTPTGFVQSGTGTGSYTLKWNAVKNAAGYRLYRYDSAKKRYVIVTNTANNYYKVSSLKAGQKADYKVRAYVKATTMTVFGDNASCTAYTCPATVTSFKQTSTTATSYTLTWNKVSNATGYRVYRFDKSKNRYVIVTNTSQNYIKVSGKKYGEVDTYKIKAYTKTTGGTVFSEASRAFEAATLPNKVTGLKVTSATSSSYKLTWSKTSGANGYRIYRKTSGGYKFIADTTQNYVVIKGLKSKTSSVYVVKAYKKTADVKVYGALSSTVKATTK